MQDGTENALKQEVGDSYFEMLQDILVHPDRPRIRDHISHGEVDISGLPIELINHILCVCVAFAGLYKIPEEDCCMVLKESALVERILGAARTYKSVFHPVAILKKNTRTLLDSMSSCHNLPKPNEDGFDLLTRFPKEPSAFPEQAKGLTSLLASASTEMRSKLGSVLYTQSDLVKSISSVLDEQMSLLFRPRSELEIVALLRNIIRHCQAVVDQVS